ncbi:hypothetical protein LZ30DRAFT_24558 [Colletotrichum cereale]|nr:hypothetical protein LZ30DRAFT_24558 [Colletotrichum cereale]
MSVLFMGPPSLRTTLPSPDHTWRVQDDARRLTRRQCLSGQCLGASCPRYIYKAVLLKVAYVLSLSWLPPTCRDDALNQEFTMPGVRPNCEWDYWADANRTSPDTGGGCRAGRVY